MSQNDLPGMPENDIPSFASTRDEIRKAVEQNAIERGVLFIKILVSLNLDELLTTVENIARNFDKEDVIENAESFSIDLQALAVLDSADPPIPYLIYFCIPEILMNNPKTTLYYRNVAMLSQKVMRGIDMDTTSYEIGESPDEETALELSNYFNEIISELLKTGGVSPYRHLEMAFTNLGDSLGGSSRNEVGRLAYVKVITPLALYLHQRGELSQIVYSLKGPIVTDDEDEQFNSRQELTLDIVQDMDLEKKLLEMIENRVNYRELRLVNGNRLELNKQKAWNDPAGKSYKIGPDLLSLSQQVDMMWAAELKGGADPAGSDEHWKTATRAFDRILDACDKTGRPKPELSFIAIILVNRVATEAQARIDQGKLTSAYNLIRMLEDPSEMELFLNDMRGFLGLQ